MTAADMRGRSVAIACRARDPLEMMTTICLAAGGARRRRSASIASIVGALALCGATLACTLNPTDADADAGDDNEDPDAGVTGSVIDREIPAIFRMAGNAQQSADDGRIATCGLDLIFEQTTETTRTDALVELTGTHGGEVARTIENPGGAGFDFQASVFGETIVRLRAPDILEILIPINDTAENAFFRALNRFDGTMDEDGGSDGTWTCAPLEIDQGGYVDLDITAVGPFTGVPQ